MSLVALAATGAVVAPVAVRAQTATTPDVSIPEVRVIATTPASSTSPRRAAPAGITAPRPARAPAPVRGRVPPPAPVVVPAVIDPTVIDRDKVPSSTQSLTSADFTRTASPNVTETLFERVPSISISDPNGNGVQQAIQYRGFTASPTQGTPQGLAVYMGGIRLNEAFGDTVNFDLIPTNAIDRADVWSNNPLFGLNALGGAINLSMKNGFTYKGSEAEMMGGSFGRGVISAQTGWNNGNQSIYLAGQGFHDDGWRQQSDANVGRFFGDVGFRDDRTEVHGVLAAAKTSFGAIAATPVQMLARDWTSIFTNPQTTDNQMILAALNGKHALTDTWTLQGNVYARNFQQKHVDGNDGNFERCSNNGSVQFRNHLCLENDGFPAPNPVTVAFRDSFAILDQNNNPIPCPPGNGNTCAPVPYGTIDRTQTRTTTVGGSFQATNAEKVFGHDNRFVVGTSVDYSQIKFNASSELGFIFPDLSVGINPNIPGMGSIIHTLGGFGYGPVGLNANTTYYGLFATDTFDITRELSATLGARLNVAKINMHDALGDSPELNTSPTYSRINPLAGLTYKYAPWLNFYGGYSESNRAPTPLELGCADRNNPCLIEGFLISDPPLKQVVGKTYEAGMRGIVDLNPGRFEWKLGVFRTDTFDDILQLASSIQGRGFFTNVQQIRRQGLEAAVEYRAGPWFAYAGYSFLDATYQFTGDLASPNNPMADDDGNVHVTPGKRVPMTPQHQFKAGADYMMTPQWTVGGTMVAVGPQVFDGDQANQNPKLPAYAVFNLRTTYQVDRNVQLFGLVNNLFNKKYLLFGSYFEPQGVQNAGLGIALTDQRTEVPGQPLSIYVGLRARL